MDQNRQEWIDSQLTKSIKDQDTVFKKEQPSFHPLDGTPLRVNQQAYQPPAPKVEPKQKADGTYPNMKPGEALPAGSEPFKSIFGKNEDNYQNKPSGSTSSQAAPIKLTSKAENAKLTSDSNKAFTAAHDWSTKEKPIVKPKPTVDTTPQTGARTNNREQPVHTIPTKQLPLTPLNEDAIPEKRPTVAPVAQKPAPRQAEAIDLKPKAPPKWNPNDHGIYEQ